MINWWVKPKELLVQAEADGRQAWKILIVNHMLAKAHLRKKQYRWTREDLAQLCGIKPENLDTASSAFTHSQRPQPIDY